MASSYSFQTYEECYESFLSEVLKDILNSEISFTLDLLVIEPRVIKFQISLPFGACPILKITCFQSFCTSQIFVVILLDIIGLEDFPLSFSKSKSRIMTCNLHQCYTFCPGVTLKLHCSQPIRIEKFFHVYIL